MICLCGCGESLLTPTGQPESVYADFGFIKAHIPTWAKNEIDGILEGIGAGK